jgi:hypothetical protein
MEVSDQRHASATLPAGKSHWSPLVRRLGEIKRQPGHFGEGIKL